MSRYNSDLTKKLKVLKPAARRWRQSYPDSSKGDVIVSSTKPATQTLFPQRDMQSWTPECSVKRAGPVILLCYRRAEKYRSMLIIQTLHTWIWQDGICLWDELVTAQSVVAFLTSVRDTEREREIERKLDLMEIRPSRKYWSTTWTHLKRHSDKSSWEEETRREDWMDRVKLKCSLRTEVAAGDTRGASRRVGGDKKGSGMGRQLDRTEQRLQPHW